MSKKSRNKKSNHKQRKTASQKAFRGSEQDKRPVSASFKPSPFSAESRKKREREQRRARLMSKKPLVVLVIVAAILAGITLLALVPGFNIEKIEVRGSYRVDEQSVKAKLSHHLGEHFLYKIGLNIKTVFRLRYTAAEREILAESPLLDRVEVYFSYPSTIKVDLDEKVELLCVRVPGGYALLDKELTVVELTEKASETFPSVEQIVLNSAAKEGEKLQTDQTDKLHKSINITAEIIRCDNGNDNDQKLLPLIRHIIWQDTNTFFLHIPSTQGGMIRVKLDDNRYLQDKLALVSNLIFIEQFADKPAGELDMTGETVHFRPDMS